MAFGIPIATEKWAESHECLVVRCAAEDSRWKLHVLFFLCSLTRFFFVSAEW